MHWSVHFSYPLFIVLNSLICTCTRLYSLRNECRGARVRAHAHRWREKQTSLLRSRVDSCEPTSSLFPLYIRCLRYEFRVFVKKSFSLFSLLYTRALISRTRKIHIYIIKSTSRCRPFLSDQQHHRWWRIILASTLKVEEDVLLVLGEMFEKIEFFP